MSKVKTIETSAELLQLIEKSGLLDDNKVESVRKICNESDGPKNAARQLIKEGVLTPWQANQLLAGFWALTMGSYRLMDQIGKGELGRVYLAQHAKMGHKVALKALASKSAREPQLVERFLAEARAAGEFEHRNVIRVLDVASDNDRPFVVTEFVAGGDLQQRVDKEGPLSPREAADLIAQTAEGLAYVHAKDVLHRDLKPANLLTDDKGVVKILDVGVGQLRQVDKPGSENTGELLLSALGYMSPEQVRGKDLDARSDIYALGGTLYFLLTGRVPYTAVSNEERDILRSTKRPVPVTSIKSDIPDALAQLCDQMMALKAADRPGSMREVVERLQTYLQEPASSEAPAELETIAFEAEDEAVEPRASQTVESTESPKPQPTKSPSTEPKGTTPRSPELKSQESKSAEPNAAAGKPKESPTSETRTAESAASASGASESGRTRSKALDTVHQVGADTVPLGATVEGKLQSLVEESEPTTVEKPAESGAEDAVKITVDGVEAAPVPAVVAPRGLKIQRKKKTEIVEAVASSGEEDSPLVLAAQKAKRQRKILIITVAASLAVILLGISVLMMPSGGETSVAQQDKNGDVPSQAAAPAAANTAPGVLDPNDPENLPDPEDIPDPQGVASPVAPAVDGGTSVASAGAPASNVPAAAGAAPTEVTPAVAPAPAGVPNPPGAPATGVTPASATAPTGAAPAAVTGLAAASTDGQPAVAVVATGTPAVPAATPPMPAATTPPATPAPAAVAGAAPAAPAAPAATPSATPPPADSAKMDAKGADPKAATPTEPAKTEPAKTDPVKTAVTKAPPAPAKAKPAKTFEIAAAVDLPGLPAAGGSAPTEAPAKILGKINIDPKDTCFLAMYGGDKAMKGRVEFSLRNAQGGTAPRDWEVVQKDLTGSEAVVATFSLPAQDFKFEWTPEGLKSPSAVALSNCAIKITAGQDKPHFVALRTVAKFAPLTIENLERSTLVAKFPLDAVPDGSALKLEPSVPNQKIIFDPGGADITKGDAWIFFGENKDQAPLALRLDCSVNPKGIQISAMPYVLLPNEKPQKLTAALRKKLSVSDLQRQATGLASQIGAMKKLKKEDQQKLQNEINLSNLAQQNLDQMIQRVQKFDELLQQLNGNGKIHFRVFYDAEETQVDLVKTEEGAPVGK